MSIKHSIIKRRDKRIWYLVGGVFVAVFSFTFLAQKHEIVNNDAGAANASAFDPGYIISDFQMSNYDSMSESQIQSFLESKNSCWDTNLGRYTAGDKVSYFSEISPPRTWHVKDGHFVCMADEVFDGGTAAHIIYQAAQDYRINPQVLLVLLEKEQSLVTDTFPHSQQYRSATGYGCPDTAACSSEYYGLKNQIRNAAALFRTVLNGGWTNYPLGNNYVQYNPSASCGGSVVNIRNLATSALYRYTPYQPNAATLSGWSDGCNAYGNLNFYKLFEDWFGGIIDSRAEWQDMQLSRVMSVKTPTLIIDADNRNTSGVWLEVGENYYFTRKTTVFWGGELQTCLQRKIDEGTNQCILINRLSDIDIEEMSISFSGVRDYKVKKWTCIVDLRKLDAKCGEKSYSIGETVSIQKKIIINNEEYLMINNDYGVLKSRTELALSYEKFGPVLMKLKKHSYKYEAEESQIVQDLNVDMGGVISIMDKVIIDGKTFYRTTHDYNNGSDYVILASDFTSDIFKPFLYPRNLELIEDTNSINLDNGQVCYSYKKNSISKYVKKIDYSDEIYYQNENEDGTHCVLKAASLRETDYNFSEKDSANGFIDFLNPRYLKASKDMYMIDIKTGKTCDELINENNIQKYNSKIRVKNIVFYRTEYNTNINSSCATPASNLLEIN